MDDKIELSNALKMVNLRNDFYRQKFYLLLAVYVLSLVAIFVLASTLVYLYSTKAKPGYFVANQKGQLQKYVPLTRLNMSEQELLDWVVEAVESATSFDYVNYRGQLQNAQKYFTESGWKNYMQALELSGNLLPITEKFWVADTKITSTPKLLKEGIVGGAKAYRYSMQMKSTYLKPDLYSGKDVHSELYDVTVIVLRKSMLESYKGLAIFSIVIRNIPQEEKRFVVPEF